MMGGGRSFLNGGAIPA